MVPTEPQLPGLSSQAHMGGLTREGEEQLAKAAELINSAKRPVIFAVCHAGWRPAPDPPHPPLRCLRFPQPSPSEYHPVRWAHQGQGVLQSEGAVEALAKVAERAQLPCTTTLQGLGCFDEKSPLSLEMLGMHGAAYANYAMQSGARPLLLYRGRAAILGTQTMRVEGWCVIGRIIAACSCLPACLPACLLPTARSSADVILGVGVRFDDRVTGFLPDFAPAAKAASATGTGGIIHFDILPKNVGKVVRPDVAVIGDCGISLNALLPMLDTPDRKAWHDKLDSWKKTYPFAYGAHHLSWSHAYCQATNLAGIQLRKPSNKETAVGLGAGF
eukprot:SAG11_NODE_408_length_9704_cov_6.496774_10_plen_330_part_00